MIGWYKMRTKLRDPRDIATEIWACVVDCQFDSEDAIEYITDMITDDRELITRKILNGEGVEMLH